jgi:hypothetical protein
MTTTSEFIQSLTGEAEYVDLTDRHKGAIADLLMLESEPEGGSTWWDLDPDVAWDLDNESEVSARSRIREAIESVGWERCYHDRGMFHYSVKVRGSGAYRALNHRIDTEDRLRGGLMDTDEVREIAQRDDDWEREQWWNDPLEAICADLGIDHEGSVFSCGRSGGYVQVSAEKVARWNAKGLIVLAAWLDDQVAYYGGEEWGTYLADQAIERYDEDRVSELASPRTEGWW